MRIDNRLLFFSVLCSFAFHILFLRVIISFKGFYLQRKKDYLTNVYEVSIVSVVRPRVIKRAAKSSRKYSSKKSYAKKRTSSSKKEILVSKRKARKSKKKVKPKINSEELLAKKLKALKEEKYLEEKLAQLKSQKSQKSISSGTQIKVKGEAVVDPLLAFYIARLVERIRLNWVLPEVKEGLETVIDVKINKKGEAVKIEFEKRSGDVVFDSSCLKAVKSSFPFEPLPLTYNKGYLEIGVRFRP